MIASTAFCWLDAPAEAQTPRFRMTPLVKLDLGYAPDLDLNGSMGINNKGQVVYTYREPISGEIHSWLWLPVEDYYFTSPGLKDLSALSSSTTDDDDTIARDINESGIIVGQAGSLVNGAGQAAAWTLASGGVTHTPLPVFASGGTWSSAHAINDQSPPVIVGAANMEGFCDCESSIEHDPETPFQLTFSGTLVLTDLDVAPDSLGEALDVNTPGTGASLRIAGFTDCSGKQDEEEGPAQCDRPVLCREPMDAVQWALGVRDELDDLGDPGSRTRAVNNAGRLARWGRDPVECIRHPLYWSSPTASATVLPGFDSDNRGRADAMNNLNPPQVVGTEEFLGVAVLWEDLTSSPITVLDLNSTAAIGGCASRWTLRQGHDINDNTWIVVYGTDSTGGYAILLSPFPAFPPDIVEDDCVDVSDMLAVITHWGACPVGQMCEWDVDGSCTVDVGDLVAVNVAWGCPECGECTCEEESSFAGPSGPPTVEEVIALVLEASIPSATQAEIIQELLNYYP